MNALTDGLTAQGRTIALVVTAALSVLIATLFLWRFSKSEQKDRWVDRIATVLVLAWTSEGMWEVATRALHLPVEFVVASFFVAESMMVSSAMRATAHRATKGVPGRAGTLVWVLAATFGLIVALNAGSLVGFLLRLALPLSAAALWWQGLTAERDTDTIEMRAERARLRAERESTWAVTPRTLLVRWGVLKPGNITITEAQRQMSVDRMVAARMVIHDAKRVKGARRKLRRLAMTATPDMIEDVRRQVRQTMLIEVSTDGSAPAGTPAGRILGTPVVTVPKPLSVRFSDGSAKPLNAIIGTPGGTPGGTVRNTPGRNPGTGTATPLTEPRRDTPEPHGSVAAGTPDATPRETVPTSAGTVEPNPADADLLRVLRDPRRVPRDEHGKVPIKRAMAVLGVGRNRAIRCLDTLGLRRFPDPSDDGSDTPATEPSQPINGTPLVTTGATPS
jgi:hypothetical protein